MTTSASTVFEAGAYGEEGQAAKAATSAVTAPRDVMTSVEVLFIGSLVRHYDGRLCSVSACVADRSLGQE
jgi:hypothetical protein